MDNMKSLSQKSGKDFICIRSCELSAYNGDLWLGFEVLRCAQYDIGLKYIIALYFLPLYFTVTFGMSLHRVV